MPNWVARVLFDIPVQIRKPGFHSAKPAGCKSPFTARSMVVGLQLQVLVVRIRCAAEKPRVLVHLGHVDEKVRSVGSQPPSPGQQNQRGFRVALCRVYSRKVEDRLHIIWTLRSEEHTSELQSPCN